MFIFVNLSHPEVHFWKCTLKFQLPGDYRIAFQPFIHFFSHSSIHISHSFSSFIHLFLQSFIHLFTIYLFLVCLFICPATRPSLHQTTPPARPPISLSYLVLFDFIWFNGLYGLMLETLFFSYQGLSVIIN